MESGTKNVFPSIGRSGRGEAEEGGQEERGREPPSLGSRAGVTTTNREHTALQTHTTLRDFMDSLLEGLTVSGRVSV